MPRIQSAAREAIICVGALRLPLTTRGMTEASTTRKASYLLFETASPTIEASVTRRFYFGGNVYDGWSTVPDRYKGGPDFSRRVEGFSITFKF